MTDFEHRINVNVGGRDAKHPIVELWCTDCLRGLGQWDQVNAWDALQHAVTEHRSKMSRREQLREQEAGRG